jgi:mono/diheme cytochrome c family protein
VHSALGVVSLLAVPIVLAGCSWFTDFKKQPRIEPWESEYAGDTVTPFRGNPQNSVPITGNPVPGYVVSYNGSIFAYPGATPNPAVIDSFNTLTNPHAPTARSLDNGRKYYQINCAVCHGAGGHGNGPAVRFGVPAPNLLTTMTVGRTDGYIYGMIRNGRGLMPNYNRIEDEDRWDVVNYVRALQGRIPGVVADTSPAGYPGENGALVPGPTRTAPTRPAPYRPQDMQARMTDSAGLGTRDSALGPTTRPRAGGPPSPESRVPRPAPQEQRP